MQLTCICGCKEFYFRILTYLNISYNIILQSWLQRNQTRRMKKIKILLLLDKGKIIHKHNHKLREKLLAKKIPDPKVGT